MMKEADIGSYTNCFNDLAILCIGLVTPEYKKIERYIWGLPHPTQGLFTTSKPTTYDSAKRLAFSLTNQEIHRGTMVQKVDLPKMENMKRKFGKEFKRKARKPIEKKREAVQAFAVMTTSARTTIGSSSRCNQCRYQHTGANWVCTKYGKNNPFSNRCRTSPNQGIVVAKDRACHECKEVGHIKKDCPKLKGQ